VDITPALFIRNEEYWIYYVLRDLFEVFDEVVLYDTGSADHTLSIVEDLAGRYSNSKLTLLCEDLGDDPNRIGNCPNVLRSMVTTEWMLLIAGDEIWGESQLRALLEMTPPNDSTVGMCNGRNVVYDNGVWMEREGFSADRLFNSDVNWIATEYPFEAHGLEDKAKAGHVFHTDFDRSYFWHTRYLSRSALDDRTFMRDEKLMYYPNAEDLRPIPVDWIGEVASWPNPYLGVASEL
jgi:hypothetical protein